MEQDNTSMSFVGQGAGRQQQRYSPVEVYVRRRPRIMLRILDGVTQDVRTHPALP